MFRINRFTAAALCAATVLAPITAGAPPSGPSRFGIGVYGWFPSVKGSTTFPSPPGGGSSSHVTIDAAAILDLDQKLSYTLGGNVGSIALPDRSGSRSVALTNFDYDFGDKLAFNGAALAVYFRS